MFEYSPPADLLADRTYLVTGAGGGIGRACVLSLLGHGASVVMLSRDQGKLENLYDEAEASWPGRSFIQPVDFSRAGAEDFGVIAASLEKQFPALDGLLHNAAVLGPRTPIEFYPEQTLSSAAQTYANVAAGGQDIGWALQGYVPGRFPATDVVEMPFVFDSSSQATEALWTLYDEFEALRDEYADVKLLGLWTTGPGDLWLAQGTA